MSAQEDDLQDELVAGFIEESTEGLDVVESLLLNLNVGKADGEQINAIFRPVHSIKGTAGMFGFQQLQDFAHLAETLLDEIRSDLRPVTQEGVDVLLRAVDCLRGMVSAIADGSEVDGAQQADVVSALRVLLAQAPGAADTAACPDEALPRAAAPQAASPRGPGLGAWKILFAPEKHLLCTGNDPLRILRELALLGDLEVSIEASGLPPLSELDPESCYLGWELRLSTAAEEATVREAFAWVEGDCALELRWEAVDATSSEGPAPRAPEALDAEAAPIADTPSQPAVPATPQPSAPAMKAEVPRPAAAAAKPVKAASSIRVATEKVDDLINQVGELVITQSMLGEIGEDFDASRVEKLMEGLEQLERNTRELQESVMRIRMLPISATFGRFPRLVRDLSQKLGKEIELRVTGEQTELDKNVLEQIGDPMVHLVRNSLDHGIEMPEVRRAAGKPEAGVIRLDAYHQGGNIVIEVSDDGGGLDPGKIRAKAIVRGLISEEDRLTDQQAQELVFQPGFSTVDQVSDISGRGVGMDVVRRNIRDLGGTVTVRSEVGKGSTFKIRLPLTLAILDGQLVRVSGETFIVPLVSIIESLQVRPELVNRIGGRLEVYRLRDEAIAIVHLAAQLGIATENTSVDGSLMVVVEGDGVKAGLIVDELLGQQQVVIKSLANNFRPVPGLSGATILGNGTAAMILDVAGLIALARTSPASPASGQIPVAAQSAG